MRIQRPVSLNSATRAGGEHPRPDATPATGPGSSPRGRGTPPRPPGQDHRRVHPRAAMNAKVVLGAQRHVYSSKPGFLVLNEDKIREVAHEDAQAR